MSTGHVSWHIQKLQQSAVPTTYQGAIALCDAFEETRARLDKSQATFPDNFFILKILEKLKRSPLEGSAFQAQLQVHELQLGKSWQDIRSNLMAWARSMISAQTGFLGVGTTGTNKMTAQRLQRRNRKWRSTQ